MTSYDADPYTGSSDVTGSTGSPAGRSKAETAKLVLGAVLLVLLTLFVVVNTDKTKIDFLVADADLPLVVVLLATAAIGALLAELFRFTHNRRKGS